MKSRRLNLIDTLLVAAAIPFWVFLLILIPQQPAFWNRPERYTITPFVLCCVTIAVHRLLRGRQHAWPASALIAGATAVAAIYFAVWFSS
jgi:hypothetical protein